MVEALLSQGDGQLTSTQTEDLIALLDELGDVFSDVHHIELKPDTKPILCAPYRLN